MNHEVLKVLLTLFSNLSVFYGPLSARQLEIVYSFFKSRTDNEQKAKDYLSLFKKATNETTAGDRETILEPCRKADRVLTEKQKIILLCELLEFINAGDSPSGPGYSISKEISNILNIKEKVYYILREYVFSALPEKALEHVVLLGNNPNHSEHRGYILTEKLNGYIRILRLEAYHLSFLRYNGTDDISLNGAPVKPGQIHLFSYGSIIRLSKGSLIHYSDILSHFKNKGLSSPISLNCKDVSFTFPDGTVALRDINISENQGTLFGIMGASGSGKTTLINILSGIQKPGSGHVAINGYDIYQQPEEIKGVVGYVAQEDLLIEELTVFENLYYNARLCFGQKTSGEVKHMVSQMLRSLNLHQIRDLKVGEPLNKFISGGQRKRLNIALELLREPAVLFVDEPTSGLSSRDSQNIIDLLKDLSLKGKLVFVVIHQPSSELFKLFDKVYLLDTGGYPVYYGSPLDAVPYFKKVTHHPNPEKGQCQQCGNINPEQIFDIMEAPMVNEFGRLTQERKIPPQTWWEIFRKNFTIRHQEPKKGIPQVNLNVPHKLKQCYLYASRDIKSKLSNKQYLAISLIQTPLLAFLLSWVVRYTPADATTYNYQDNVNIPAYFLMSVIVALFTGLMNSAEEIIKDKKTLNHERFLNLSRHSYLSAKIFILFFISGIQTAMYVTVGNIVLDINGFFPEFWLIFFSTTCFANIIGLNMSSAMNSAVNVYIAIPLMLIPQMILSGALFPYEKLHPTFASKHETPVIADLMVARWAYEALAVQQYTDNHYQEYFYKTNQKIRKAHVYKDFVIPKLSTIHSSGKENTTVRVIIASMASDMNLSLDDNLETEELILAANQALIKLSNKYTFKKEYIMDKLKEKGMSIKKLKNKHYNESLSNIVRNIGAKERIVLENNTLYINTENVFFRPETQHFLDYRAHLFAPEKHIGGVYVSTFTFNCMVIWLFCIPFYITLYRETFNLSIKKII